MKPGARKPSRLRYSRRAALAEARYKTGSSLCGVFPGGSTLSRFQRAPARAVG